MPIQDLLNKLKGFAAKNPDKARQAIDKVENVVDQRTGGKYRSQVDKAGDAAGNALGVPSQGQATPPAPGQPAPQQPAPQQPAPPQGQQPPTPPAQ